MAKKGSGLHLDGPIRKRVYDSIAETIGNTPLVHVHRWCAEHGLRAPVLAKLEFFNPLASVKDRIGVGMIEAMEAEGTLEPGGTMIEPTSGNTGIGLAFVASARGYRLILTMPESVSVERQKMLRFLGAEVVLTPRENGMKGAIAKADELLAENKDAVKPDQFGNPANPQIHARTTAEEIWADTDGAVDIVISGVGTGGTLTGIGSVLKARKESVKMVAIEPEASPVLSGGEPGLHPLQGIGAGFVPEILDTSLIDEIVKVGNDESIAEAKLLARLEGIPGGLTSGAAMLAARGVAAAPGNENKTIVVILPSFAERYLSTVLFEGV